MLNLTTADDRSDRIRCNDKNKSIGGFNCTVDGLHEFFRWSNAFPIDPCLSPSIFQRLIQPAHEVPVLASVGNEDLRHFLSAIVLAIFRLSPARITRSYKAWKLSAIFNGQSQSN